VTAGFAPSRDAWRPAAPAKLQSASEEFGGEAGIRTLGTGFSPYNGLANRRLQPLGHLTADGKYNGKRQLRDRDSAILEATICTESAFIEMLRKTTRFDRSDGHSSGHRPFSVPRCVPKGAGGGGGVKEMQLTTENRRRCGRVAWIT
jgi:hypothetical protein